jgi:hypothetical protein
MSNVRSHLRRLYVSVIGLPLLAMAVFAALACGGRAGGCAPSEWLAASLVVPGFVLILFPQVVLLVIASIWFLLRFRFVAWWHFALAGAAIGAVSAFPFVWHDLANESLRWGYRLSELGGLGSPAAATAAVLVLFWLAAVWRNRALTGQAEN